MEKKSIYDKFLSAVIEQSSEGMAIAGLEGILMYVNPAWSKMHGYDAAENLIGSPLSISHNQEQIEKCVTPFNRIVFEKGTNTGEVGHIRKDGPPFPTLMTTTLLKDDNEKPIAILGIAKDITEIKKAVKELRQSETRFCNLVEAIGDWAWEIDENNIYTYVSPKVKNILGYESREILGKNIFDIRLLDESLRVRELFHDISANRKKFSFFENITIHKDGHFLVTETSGVPLFDDDGTFRGYQGVDRDITDHKQAERNLRESEKNYRELAENANSIILRWIQKLKKYPNLFQGVIGVINPHTEPEELL